MTGKRPGADQIRVALRALRDDADRWSQSAADLRTAKDAIAAATLDPMAFSVLGDDMARAYAALHDRVAGLVADAAGNLESVTGALRASADTYEREERANVHRLRGIY